MKQSRYTETTANGCFSGAYFMGRWIQKTILNQRTMYTTNLGAAVLLMTKHTDCLNLKFLNITPTARFQPEIAIFIDDDFELRFKVNEAPDELHMKLKVPHLIRIVFAGNSDSDEIWQQSQGLAITHLSVPNPGVAIPVKPAGKTIAFIGDSITAGCWVLKRTPSSGYAAEQNYAAQTARNLDAQDLRIAYSAAGLLRYGTGGVPAAPRFIKYIDFETPAPQYHPDVVVINIGTNDRRFDGSLMKIQFLNFFHELQNLFPEATLSVLIPYNQSFAKEIRELVQENPSLFFLIETAQWPLTFTDQAHPDLQGSAVAAKQLTNALLSHYGSDYFKITS
ncbi:SGNH/GDSL hydrolase family protein [Pediococcus inopinatus]|uniref:SGNH/GDSL hydrolase family protein n=1 Tax=Pediococcus inopinatus TaxID=114090 RepID=UPI002B25DFE4|nr:SGNH/GDSL hydrolase family protein [Pediococcus inopinatus]WPC16826.1 SGNH/GDSL hydrolase family protein [Pediococcus inopinatus]